MYNIGVRNMFLIKPVNLKTIEKYENIFEHKIKILCIQKLPQKYNKISY